MFLTIVVVVFAISFILFYCYSKFEYIKCDSNVCLIGKTALVTGGSKGLGYEIVLQLASRGCRVIVASRTVDEDLKRRMIEETDNPNIVLEYVDFASFKSVRELAERLKKSETKLDILINNAGVAKSLRKPTADGVNRTMQVNYYSAFLLTHLLVDLLKKSENARIVFTSSFLSALHFITRHSVTPTTIKDSPLGLFDYNNSKFCLIILADMFAKKLQKWNITSNSYQPGIAKTEIFKETRKNVENIFETVLYYSTLYISEVLFSVNPRLTSQGAVQIAIAKEYKNVTATFVGRFLHNLKPIGAHDMELCDAIWKTSEEVVKLKEEERLE